jgi:hypothetical protein
MYRVLMLNKAFVRHFALQNLLEDKPVVASEEYLISVISLSSHSRPYRRHGYYWSLAVNVNLVPLTELAIEEHFRVALFAHFLVVYEILDHQSMTNL